MNQDELLQAITEAELPGVEDASASEAVRYMEWLKRENESEWARARETIVAMEPEQICSLLGPDALVWAVVNAESAEGGSFSEGVLARLAGYRKDLLLKAARWSEEKYGNRDFAFVLAGYRLAETVVGGDLLVDLPALLQAAARPGMELSSKRIGEYSLVPVQASGKRATGLISETFAEVEPNTYYRSGLDAPVGYLLKWRLRPQATVALGMSRPDEIMIYQMQGIIGKEYDSALPEATLIRTIKTRGLAVLNWHGLFVQLAQIVGRKVAGVERIGIQGAANNHWVHHIEPGEEEPHLTVEAAEYAYDAPAERAGFTKGADGNWHLSLEPVA